MSKPTHVSVLVLTSLPNGLLRRISGVGPGVRVADGAALLLDELPSALRVGQPPAPRRSKRSLNHLLAEAEVVLAARRMPANLGARAPRLRWVQWAMAGVDFAEETDIWTNSKVMLTSAAGINARPVAEHVMMMALALVKGLPRMQSSQAQRRWDRFAPGQLHGKTLGIVGYGALGREVATLAQAFGTRVLATKRRIDPGLPSWVLPHTQLDKLLAECDVLVLCVPSAPDTVGLIGQREIARLKPAAVLINVARGDVVDETALIDALRSGRLAGAGLDVVAQEPLPPESPLWSMSNVLISPHIAGLFEDYDARLVDLFVANLKRYTAGEPLMNVVERR